MENITKEQYAKMLDSHDWYYQFSDDHRVYRAGEANRRKLEHYAKIDGDCAAMYEQKRKEVRV